MISYRLDLSQMLAPNVEDGAILVYDGATRTLKGTRIVIKEDDNEQDKISFPIFRIEGTPLGEKKIEYLVYDNANEKPIYSNREMKNNDGIIDIKGEPLGGDKQEYLAYDNAINSIAYSNKEIRDSDSGLIIEGTPLGSDKIEYLVYDNAINKAVYSNKEISNEVLKIEGMPLGGDKVEYLVYDNNTKNLIFSNVEFKSNIFLYATVLDDLTGIEFNPIIFDNAIENGSSLYNSDNGEIEITKRGVYKIEITLDCIVLNSADIPSDVTTTITRIRNGDSTTVLAEKIYSLNQSGETKFIKTEFLGSLEISDKISFSLTSSAIYVGIVVKKSSSLMCYCI